MAIYRSDYPSDAFGSAFGQVDEETTQRQRQAAIREGGGPDPAGDPMDFGFLTDNPVSNALMSARDTIYGPWEDRFWGIQPGGPFHSLKSDRGTGGTPGIGAGGGTPINTASRIAMQAAMNAIRGKVANPLTGTGATNFATQEDYDEYLASDDTEPYYIGGLPQDAVTRATREIPGQMDMNLKDRRGRIVADAPAEEIDRFGKPVYRQGDEVKYGSRLNVKEVRDWQAFFSTLGFKTGPAGAWTEREMDAMRAMMMYANGTPGGGMTVETLRDRVTRDIQNGLNVEELNLPGLLGEESTFAEGGARDSGQDVGEELGEPYTVTETERQITEFSKDEAMAAIRQVLAKDIGRAPTNAEARRFMSDVNSAFRDDPTVITSVTTVDPVTGEQDTERTVDETGVSVEERALQFGREDVPEEELREYQTGRYIDVIAQELGI